MNEIVDASEFDHDHIENYSSDNDDNGDFCTPPEIRDIANQATKQLLPSKSRKQYENAYLSYTKWKINNQIKSKNSENVLLAYFNEMSQKLKPSTLWSIYSMLKHTINLKENIDISKYTKCISFLKRKSDGYKPKKSLILNETNIRNFLKKAPNEIYLATKIALIFGVTGACRRGELSNVTVKDVSIEGNVLIVKIPDTKTKIPRSFVIEGEFFNLVRQYMNSRPDYAKTDRFFLNWQKGRCTSQPIGKNKFGQMPKTVAHYLNLEDAQLYTGHCFRRTSATLLANSGADILTVKRHGGWKSSTVAEGYIENSITNKRKINSMITTSITLTSPLKKQSKLHKNDSALTSKSFNQNLTFNASPTKNLEVQEIDNPSIVENFTNEKSKEETSQLSGCIRFDNHNCQITVNNYYLNSK